MSVEELRKAVLEKARAEADEILREAVKRAEAIIRDAEEKKRRFVESEKEKLRAALQIESRVGEARRRARLIISSVKAEVAKEVKERALNLLRSMDSAKREESLRSLLEDAIAEVLRAVPSATLLEVHAAPADKPLVEKLLREKGLKYEVREDPSILGGVRVSCCGGDVVVDNTYNTRLGKGLADVLREISRELGA
ncbi:V-type ATP synthase subunit E [Thermogladius sp.]|uniref:V-type ATP synthase subunit E n=1 Tax=Thermogladius sp. TaxID=2023064 RepID=UPI003D148EDE